MRDWATAAQYDCAKDTTTNEGVFLTQKYCTAGWRHADIWLNIDQKLF